MAAHSVGAWDEFYESEVSQALMYCFENASLEKSCLVIDLVCFVSPFLHISVFLNVTRMKCFFFTISPFKNMYTATPRHSEVKKNRSTTNKSFLGSKTKH